MTRAARLVALAAELVEANKAVARIEGKLAALLGGASTITRDGYRPGRRLKQAEVTAPGKSSTFGGSALPPKASGRRSDRQDRVVALAKAGKDAGEIAAELGTTRKIINMALWRARKAGQLPKAEVSR